MKKKTAKKTMKKAEPSATATRSYKSMGSAMPDPDPREALAAEAAAMMNQGVPTGTFGSPPPSPYTSVPNSGFAPANPGTVGFGGAPFVTPPATGFGGGGQGSFGRQQGEKSQFDFVTVLFSGKEGKSYSATIKNDDRGNKVMTALLSMRPGDAIGVSQTKAPDKYGRPSLNLWIRRKA